jgi:hypothetical protein
MTQRLYVAAELGNFRESFEHGNMFPKAMIDATVANNR